ncbi:hypothetical protein ID866_1420 [Astraeus odoratus]|nr:hypothetical protein ID866_1420 [Astraeus odoratus]
MMESRKRPLVEDGDVSQVKKRVFTGVSGSPELNGVRADSAEPTENDQLELFRKDAIFRRMRHYSRENERSQARIAQLEQRKSSCEAGLVAIAACWQQLVETIRTLTSQDDMPAVDVNTQDLFDLSQHVSSEFGLKATLEQNMHATQKLVTNFLKSNPAVANEAYERFQKTETECTALRSQVVVMQKRLGEAEADMSQYREQLATAEMRIDRLRSGIVATVQGKSSPKEDAMDEDPTPTVDDSPHPASPPVSSLIEILSMLLPAQRQQAAINGHEHPRPEELEELKEKLRSREECIVALESENMSLTKELINLRTEIKAPSVEIISETPHYKLLKEVASRLQQTVDDKDKEVVRLNKTIHELRSSRKEFEDETIAASQLAQQELKTLLSKRDADNLRVREQRDQFSAELAERKAKDSVKLQSMHELKELAELRSERIAQLQSEVARHKAKLAAQSGVEDLMKYFFQGKVDDVEYIHGLKEKLDAAEMKLAAMEEASSILHQEHPDISRHIASETSVREDLMRISRELEHYRAVFGESSDQSALAQKLLEKNAEIQRLGLVNAQQAQAESSLCAEVDRLSSSWENLEQQLKKKVFDLSAFEEKLQRVMHEKAKAENKYFAAMREKDMGESERKAMVRQLEKQGKAVERALEVERSLNAQLVELEKVNDFGRQVVEESDKKIQALESAVRQSQVEVEAARLKFNESRHFSSKSSQHQRRLEAHARALEEDLVKVKREAEKKIKKMSATAAPASTREEALSQEIEGLWKIMKCSTCKQGMREVVLTKCMHTFCKNCVDTRISTRQRRCPHCNLAFAQSDVQTVYFQ